MKEVIYPNEGSYLSIRVGKIPVLLACDVLLNFFNFLVSNKSLFLIAHSKYTKVSYV